MSICGKIRMATLCATALLGLQRDSVFAETWPASDSLSNDTRNVLQFHQQLYLREPAPIDNSSRPQGDPVRRSLEVLDHLASDEIALPPILSSRLSSLPGEGDDSTTQAVLRAEYTLLRERARAADQLFRAVKLDDAISLMESTERQLTLSELRAIALNRIAAYYFRLQQTDKMAEYSRQAWELAPGDAANACNLAASLLSLGEVDEALIILLGVYDQAREQPKLAFSLYFNLACAYSLKKDTAKALHHLFLAARVDPAATLAAFGDTQLDSIRDHPEVVRLRGALLAAMQSEIGAATP